MLKNTKQPIPGKEQIAFYQFNKNGYDTINGYNMSINGTVKYSDVGVFSNAFELNGKTGMHPNTNIVKRLGDEITVSLWFFYRGHVKDDDIIFNLGAYTLEVAVYNGNEIRIAYGDSWHWINTYKYLEVNQFYHIAATYKRSTGRVYLFVNDELVYTGARKASKPFGYASGNKLGFGARYDNSSHAPNHFLKGAISQIRIFNKVLTHKEIRELYTESRVTYEPSYTFLACRSMGGKRNDTKYQDVLEYRFEGQELYPFRHGKMTLDFKFQASKAGKYSVALYATETRRTYIAEFDYKKPHQLAKITVGLDLNQIFGDSLSNDENLRAKLFIAPIGNSNIFNGKPGVNNGFYVGTNNTRKSFTRGDYIIFQEVQLLPGTVINPKFQYPNRALELLKAKRYYEVATYAITKSSSDDTFGLINYVEKRAVPSFRFEDPITHQANYMRFYSTDGNDRKLINCGLKNNYVYNRLPDRGRAMIGNNAFTPKSWNDAMGVVKVKINSEL